MGYRIASVLGLPSNIAAQICAPSSHIPSSNPEDNREESTSKKGTGWDEALSALNTRADTLPEHWRDGLMLKESSSDGSSFNGKWREAVVAVAAEAHAHRSIGGKSKKGSSSTNSSFLVAAVPSAETTSACAQLPSTPALTSWYNKWDIERSKRAVKSGSAGGGSRAKGGKVTSSNLPVLQKNKQQSPPQMQPLQSENSVEGHSSNDDAPKASEDSYEEIEEEEREEEEERVR